MKMVVKMVSTSPVTLNITERISQLRALLPIPSSLLNRKWVLVFILCICIMGTLYFHNRSEFDSLSKLDINYDLDLDTDIGNINMSSVVIFTRYRSGSSLIGDLFCQNKDVFFVFEPFKLFPDGPKWRQYIRSQASYYLSSIGRCQFQGIVKDSITLPNVDMRFIRSWKDRVFCPKLSITENRVSCHKMHISEIERVCRKYSHIVTKIIRVYDVTALVPFLQRDQKIINLLRDPRGMISSRIKIDQVKSKQTDEQYFKDLTLRVREASKAAEKACADISENLHSLRRLVHEVPEFSKLYYIIRYEDFAENPIKHAKALYRFAGLTFDKDVHNWLISVTSGVSDKQATLSLLKYSYSTQRNSSLQTSNAWREHLPYQVVRAIQNACQKEMNILGYIPVTSVTELTDMDYKLHSNLTLHWL